MACGTNHPIRGIPCRGEGETSCEVTGLAVLSPTRLLVADSWNKSVKIVSCDPRDAGVVNRLTFRESPFDVTITPGDEAAVSFPGSGTVVFLQTCNDRLKVTRMVKTDKLYIETYHCYGIHYSNNCLFVICNKDSNGCIKVLNVSNGEHIAEFTHAAILGAHYVTTINDVVYVSNANGLTEVRNTLANLRYDFEQVCEFILNILVHLILNNKNDRKGTKTI